MGQRQRIAVIGIGLIGGSVARGLRAHGHHVVGFDRDARRLEHARSDGIIDEPASTVADAATGSDVVFVALPVGAIAEAVVEALDAGAPMVTDVGSVKAPIVEQVTSARPDDAARFVGGHPMAGSEQEGLDGASSELFRGATWVLTPVEGTDAGTFAELRALIGALGAEVVAMDPGHHDAVVAVVSHVPHLAAGTLMLIGSQMTAGEHAAFLRLAAGGFRDMTRVAAGHPGIWPDICVANRDAIVDALDQYMGALEKMRDAVAAGDRAHLLASLESARVARTNLPISGSTEGALAELRVPVPDRPGVLAQVTTLAGQLGVNIVDLEIAHSLEGPEGVLVLVVPEAGVVELEHGLTELGYHCSWRSME